MAKKVKTSETSKLTETEKIMIIEKSLSGLDGWLAFLIIALGSSAIGCVWAFFVAIISMIDGASGVDLGIAIETLVFSLILLFLCSFSLVLWINRKRIALLWTYITLGVMAIFSTVVSMTAMFNSYEKCSYVNNHSVNEGVRRYCETVGLSASEVVALTGAIIMTWIGVLLLAYYLKKSRRVKRTLIK